ncbi:MULTISPECIES: sigma-70 family RNA polymerase sigma factor [unclassified Streptomyces]|uniref:RNA polymerase sigma factor n=1 Tax=unclassified Streptomyces TaxID=2593676 RepID=UPI0003678BB2|nr:MULTISPECIES: sigma-70 family RNA polymerase sigma factor [unclassified Streptomyces]MYT29147.1 sigma-70 family RNA polymerase sigma factor [Streptomyces sp. SID8354]
MRQLSGGGDDSGEAHRRLSKEREDALMEDALRTVVPRLISSVTRVTRDYHLAQDITQETCIAILQAFRRGTEFDKPVIVFATVVARNKLRDHWRKASSGERLYDEPPEHARKFGPEPTIALEYLELLESVKTAIVDERQAAVWELTHVWGLKGIEIAELLEISSATVSRELAAAEAKARAGLRRDDDEPAPA